MSTWGNHTACDRPRDCRTKRGPKRANHRPETSDSEDVCAANPRKLGLTGKPR